MILQDTKNVLERHLGAQSVQLIDEKRGILKGRKNFHDKPYQIIYVDCSSIWRDNEFDIKRLESYQEDNLRNDYYKEPGFLQWNFYYAFIDTSKEISNQKDKKNLIESNETYARKLVMTLEELDQWLASVELLSKPSETALEKDLSSIWINKLRDDKLDTVFLDTTYVSGVESYLKGNPILAPDKKSESGSLSKSDKPSINGVSKLHLEKYRDYPIQKQFSFGKVNLIKGVNGCGKTSLLEAIELHLCGLTYRNPNSDTSKYNIQAFFNDHSNATSFSPGNTRLFKERDKIWYNNADQKFNRLHISFNKYNFYNTDAAYALANEPSKSNVKKAFEDIALGDEVNRIEQRLFGFKERFYKEWNYYKKIVSESDLELQAESKQLKKIAELNDNPEQFLEQFINEASAFNWILEQKNLDKRQIAKVEKDLVIATTTIENIRGSVNWLKPITLSLIGDNLRNYLQADKQLKELSKEIEIKETKLEQTETNLLEEVQINDLLTLLERYYSEPKIEELNGIKSRMSDLRSELSQLKKIRQLNKTIPDDQLKTISLSSKLGEYEVLVNQQIDKTEKEKIKAEEQHKKLTASLNQLEKVVNELKLKGKEYLRIVPSATQCPLCYAEYNSEALVRLINESRSNIRSSGAIENLTLLLNKLSQELNGSEEQLSVIEILKQVAYIMYGEEGYKKTISVIRKEAIRRIEDISKKETFIDELSSLSEYFSGKELKETEFAKLTANLEKYEFVVRNQKDFLIKVAKQKQQLKTLQNTIGNFKLELLELEKKRKEILANVGFSRRTTVELEERIEALNDAKSEYDRLLKLIRLDSNENVIITQKNILHLSTLLETYKTFKKQKEESEVKLNGANERIKELTKKIQENQPWEKVAKKAYDSIETIVTKHSKENYLKSFIEKNKDEIVEIFKMIHAPKEFNDLILEANGNISLKREKGNELTALTEISTGQRAALSLSIFLALNRKLNNGPNMLLFDDPVTNVDDLNILSFFDYLREVAINGNRQIFFATANESVSFLFEQKFKFLENDFQVFPLSR